MITVLSYLTFSTAMESDFLSCGIAARTTGTRKTKHSAFFSLCFSFPPVSARFLFSLFFLLILEIGLCWFCVFLCFIFDRHTTVLPSPFLPNSGLYLRPNTTTEVYYYPVEVQIDFPAASYLSLFDINLWSCTALTSALSHLTGAGSASYCCFYGY